MKTTIISTIIFSTLAVAGPARGPLRTRQNAQQFNGALGGIPATPIEDSGIANRPFQVKEDTFVNLAAAVQRSCDQQFNGCANLANGGDPTITVADCAAQKGTRGLETRQNLKC